MSRETALPLIKLGLASGALLMAALFVGVTPVNAEGLSSGHGDGVIRIGVTSRNGTRRVLLVRQKNEGDQAAGKPRVSKGEQIERSVAPLQSEPPWIFVPEGAEDSTPPEDAGVSQCTWIPASNVLQTDSEATAAAFSDSDRAAQADDKAAPKLIAPPAPEPPKLPQHEAADDARPSQAEPGHAERAVSQAEADHGDRVETSRVSVASPDARQAPSETTGLLAQSGLITIVLILCVLLLLIVIVLLLRRLSIPWQPTIRVEMSHAPTMAPWPQGANGWADGQPRGAGRGATTQQDRRFNADETTSIEAAIWEQIVDDNVALSEQLAASAV